MKLKVDEIDREFSQAELQQIFDAALTCAAANRCSWEGAEADALTGIDQLLCELDPEIARGIEVCAAAMEKEYARNTPELDDDNGGWL